MFPTRVVRSAIPRVHHASVSVMSNMRIQTRKRGEAANKVALFAKVDEDVKAKVDQVAATFRISQAAATEFLLRNIVVDADGRPEFWDGPLPIDEHEELPLANSA